MPSRLSPGRFYALPQSPQIFKQLLMVAGFDRYYQIVRCFRDEDLRSDRQPEFTQVDLEMSFVTEEDVMGLLERWMALLFKEVLGLELALPIPRLTWAESMLRTGTDRPDLRYGLEIQDLTALLRDSEARVFRDAAASGGVVRAINAKGAGEKLSRKQLDDLVALAQCLGARGLAWIRVAPSGWQGPLAKFFKPSEMEALAAGLGMEPGDTVFFGADQAEVVAPVLGHIRSELAGLLNLIPGRAFALCWVTDFPLFEWSQEEKRLVSAHHPFTAPKEADEDKLEGEPKSVLARAYDMVLNGSEIGGGSIRIHSPELQARVFRALKLEKEEIEAKFGFFLEALSYGAPPHGGCAFGLDRLAAIFCGSESIRDVIAFPKTQKGACPLTGAPSRVAEAQLRELALEPSPKTKSP